MKTTALLSFLFFSCIEIFAQCPSGQVPGPNLIVNGDFSGGNTGFYSTYIYCNSSNCLFPLGDDGYAVGANPNFFHVSFHGADHTTGTGNLMIINGSDSSLVVWRETVPVQPHTQYLFSIWVCAMYPINPAKIKFMINGVDIGDTTAPSSINLWIPFTTMWNSGANTSATVMVKDRDSTWTGSDYGLDDISLQTCGCNFAIDAGNDTTICYGNEVKLNPNEGVADSYKWFPGTGLSCDTCQSPIAIPLANTTYVLQAVSGACTDEDTIIVNVSPAPNVSAGPDTAICPGKSVELYAEGGDKFTWMPAQGLSSTYISNPEASPIKSTTYTVIVTSVNGCTGDTAVSVEAFPDFTIHTTTDTSICQGKSLMLKISGGSTYQWSPKDFLSCTDCSEVNITPLQSTTYTVTVIDDNGCSKNKAIFVEVSPDCYFILMPSAFSPNKDGNNDFLFPLGSGIENVSWRVYNRWGERVFETDNINDKWDGTFNQANAPVGAYVWYLNADLLNGKHVQMKGNVTLLR